MTGNLQSVAESARAYAVAHPLDATKLEIPRRGHYHEVMIDDVRYRLCLTYQHFSNRSHMTHWLLSVYTLDPADPMPPEDAAKRIADAIFPNGNYQTDKTIAFNVLGISRKYVQFTDDRSSITCPQCGMVSYNPQDILNQYCGNCHQFHAYMKKPNNKEHK